MILNKKVLIFSALVLLLTACGGGSSDATTNTTGTTTDTTTDTSTDTTTDTTDTSDATSGTDTQCTQTLSNEPEITANAGEDITAHEGYTVTLDGLKSTTTGSFAVITGYQWCENGKLLGDEFGIHVNDFSLGQHIVTLIVRDNRGYTTSDNVIVNIIEDPKKYLPKMVKKTGQTTSYAEFDDGYYQKGLETNYSRDDVNNIVTDHVTGLMWQDNTTGYKPYVTLENWDLGDFNNTSGDTAATYCENLTLGDYTDWRLPSLRELQTIIDHETAFFSSKIDSVFNNSNGDSWTSTPSIRFPGMIWYVDFRSGEIDRWFGKENHSVRCVRSNAHTSKYASFSRNNGIVTDNHTNLQWQDDYSDNNNTIEYAYWLQGISYCENLTLGGHTDWRLPNKNELVSLHDHRKYLNAFDNIFQYHAGTNYFMTSTTNEDDYNEIYCVEFSEGDVSVTPKEDSYYGNVAPIRCVRGN